MSPQTTGPGEPERKRRYLVHLIATRDEATGVRRYIARIRPWSARPNLRANTEQRSFADECELAEMINPLLPQGSDVRHVLGHIESPDGFLYLLSLTPAEAASLGWQGG